MSGEVTTRLDLAVSGMHCSSCGLLIDDTLEDLPGVARSRTDVRTERTVVEFDPSRAEPADLIAAIRREGYEARPL